MSNMDRQPTSNHGDLAEDRRGAYGLVQLEPRGCDHTRFSGAFCGATDVTIADDSSFPPSSDDKMYDGDNVLYPMTTSFRLVGCMHYGVKHRQGKFPRPSLTFIYSLIVLVIVWLNAFRFLFIFSANEKFGGVLFSKLVNLTWFLQCALNQSACFLTSYKKDHLPKFLEAWMQIKRTDSEWPTRRAVVRRKSIAFAVISWLCVTINVSYLTFGLMKSTVFDVWLMPLHPKDVHVSVRFLCILLGIILSGTWIFPLVLTYSSSAIIYRDFLRFNDELHQAIGPNGILNGRMNYFRRKHQKICRLAGISDNCMYLLNAITVTANIIIICIGLYGIAFYAEQFTESTLVLLDVIYKISFSVLMMSILLFGGAAVNTKAHKPLCHLYNIDLQSLTKEDQIEMSVFLQKLNGPPIGLTVGSLFTIDKMTILTILGILMTYFVVLVEFRPNFEDSATVCNLTALIENGTLTILGGNS